MFEMNIEGYILRKMTAKSRSLIQNQINQK